MKKGNEHPEQKTQYYSSENYENKESHFSIKYECGLWLSNLIEINKDISEWSKLFFEDGEIIDCIISTIFELLNVKTQPLSVVKIGLDTLDELLTSETDYFNLTYGDETHNDRKYFNGFIEKNITDILEGFDPANEEIQKKSQSILINHQLKELDDNEIESLVEKFDDDFRSRLTSGQ